MAKSGIELAFVDLVARLRGEPIARLLGGARERVEVGVSLGIQPTVEALDERVRRFLALGYRRIKLKIKPGADVSVVGEIRKRHPGCLSPSTRMRPTPWPTPGSSASSTPTVS